MIKHINYLKNPILILLSKISDEDEFEYDGFDNYESQGDVKFQNIKTTSRKMGDPAMWDLFEVSFNCNLKNQF